MLVSYSALSVDYSLRGTGYHYNTLESLLQGGELGGGEHPAEVLIVTGRAYTEGVRTLCSLWIGTQTGKIQKGNLKMEIVEGVGRDWSGCYGKIADVTDRWLSQQPSGETPPPSESASTVGSDQSTSVPSPLSTIRSRVNRFSGQVL